MSGLGQKLRQLRKQKQMTQYELAQGISSASMVSQIEADRVLPSAELLQQFADRLGIDVSYFGEAIHLRDDVNAHYRRARTLMESGQFAEAVELLESVVEPNAPLMRSEVILQEIIQCYVQLGRLADAARTYDQMIDTAIGKGDIHTAVHACYHLGHLHRRQKQMELARIAWQRGTHLLLRHPESPMPIARRLYANLGRAYLLEGRYQEALQTLRDAQVLASEFPSTADMANIEHSLANVLMEQNEFLEAHRYSLKALEHYRETGQQRGIHQCHVNVAASLRGLEQHGLAIQYVSECLSSPEFLEDRPSHGAALHERALCYLSLRRLEEALDDASQGLALLREPTSLKLNLAKLKADVLFQQGQLDNAMQSLMEAKTIAADLNNEDALVGIHKMEIGILRASGEENAALSVVQGLANQLLANHRFSRR